MPTITGPFQAVLPTSGAALPLPACNRRCRHATDFPRSGNRQGYTYPHPVTGFRAGGFHGDRAAVSLDGHFAEAEAQTGPAAAVPDGQALTGPE